MHPNKVSMSVQTDILTDSETIYEAYVRLLTLLNRKVIHSGVCVPLSVLYARREKIFININILNLLNRKVSRSGASVLLSVLYARGEGGQLLFKYI